MVVAGRGGGAELSLSVPIAAGPATGTDVPDATPGPTVEELDRAFAAHGITNVGPPMEQAEAERLLDRLDQGASIVV